MSEPPSGWAGVPVLVTGASGFIGSHLTRRLVAEGAQVHALTSAVSSVYPTRLLQVRHDLTLHEGSLADRGAMLSVVRAARPEVVFHLGAYTHVGKSWSRTDECIDVNIHGTVNLLQALDEVGYRRFVNTGTSEIYGDVPVPFREDGPVNPISPYSVSKYAAERYCRMFHQAHGWPIVMVRPFNAYGPAQSPDRVIPEIIGRAARRQPLLMTQGRQTREFNHVDDLVEGFLLAGSVPGVEGQLVNLGNGEDVSVRDLTTMVLDLMGNPVEPSFGALPDRPTEIWQMHADGSRARELLGWSPRVSLRDGLASTIEWYVAELGSAESSFAP